MTEPDIQPEFFCQASDSDMPHIPAYPWVDSWHPAMVTSKCLACGQEMYRSSSLSHLYVGNRDLQPGGFVMRLIIHEDPV